MDLEDPASQSSKLWIILEGYAAFTRDAPLAGRNLERTVENLRKDSIWIREISR